jgi:lipopolysaccharide/colanic/teichoic acid biosynthesis glycosyltransferase
MDIVGSFIGILMLSPLLLFISFLIMITMGRPIFFKQIRPGLYAKPFVLYKFRTMLDLKNEDGNLLPDEKRLTTVGKFLRKTSLDELPELWNVIKGQMSLVGPRPLLIRYLPYFTEKERKRFQVKPGITGLAQLSGRNQLSWNKRLELDCWYVENWSLLLDLKLLLLTFLKVVSCEGVADAPRSLMMDLDEERKAWVEKNDF